jgi:hypothetical protein
MKGTVMSESEAAVSGDAACLTELTRLIYTAKSERKLLAEHAPDSAGRCPRCRSIGCTLYAAAFAVKKIRAKAKLEQGRKTKKLGGSGT